MEWAAGVEMPAEWVMAGVPVEWAAVLEAQEDRAGLVDQAVGEAVIKTIYLTKDSYRFIFHWKMILY